MAKTKKNYFRRFVDTLRGGDIEAEDLEDRMDTTVEEVQEVPLEEAKPFTANPLAGVANMAESVFYTGAARHQLDDEHSRFIPEQYRQEHEPYRYDPNGDGQVCISAANIYEIHPKNISEPSVKIHPLKPLIISAPRNGVVYSHFATDNQGRIKSTFKGVYTLESGKALPKTYYFQLPNEDDAGGQEGDYYIPICYFKDGKMDRHQFTGGREARLMGSLMGIRGPLIWNTGYNKLKNIGDGKNVYRSYVPSADYKELRTIRGRRTLDNTGSDTESDDYEDPAVFCNDARIKVKYAGEDEDGFNKSAASEIVVTGNGYDKKWECERTNIPTGETASSTRIAIIEDGLVNSVKDIPYVEYARQQIQTVPVLTTPTTGSSTTAVISEWSLRSVVKNVTVTNYSDSNSGGNWTGGTSTADNVVVSASVGNDYVRGGTVNSKMIQGIPHNKMWSGGTEETIDYVKICVSSSSTTGGTSEICYWVLGEVATNNVAPASVTYVDSPISCVGVTSAVQITSVQDSTTTGGGVESTTLGQGIIGTNISTSDFVTAVTTDDETNMVKYVAEAAVPLVNSSTVNVYKENPQWSGKLLDAAQAQTTAKLLEVPASDAPKRCDNPPD